MKKNITIFYCWQSDKNEESNYIYYALKKCIYNINNGIEETNTNEVSEQEKIELDKYFLQNRANVQYENIILIDSDIRGSRNNTPAKNIMNNIKTSDIFICDLTPIAEIGDIRKQVPNPNVMFELGVAVATIGWGNTLMLTKTKHDYARFPFDVNSYKIRHLVGEGSSLLQTLLQDMINSHLTHHIEFGNENKKLISSQYNRLIVGKWIDCQTQVIHSFADDFSYSFADEKGKYTLNGNIVDTKDISGNVIKGLTFNKQYTILKLTPVTLIMSYKTVRDNKIVYNILTLKRTI